MSLACVWVPISGYKVNEKANLLGEDWLTAIRDVWKRDLISPQSESSFWIADDLGFGVEFVVGKGANSVTPFSSNLNFPTILGLSGARAEWMSLHPTTLFQVVETDPFQRKTKVSILLLYPSSETKQLLLLNIRPN